MYFYVVIIKSLSTVHKYAITVFIYSGTSMGHAQWGCGHTFDAQQIFLLPPFLWGDCDKIWHGWALVIVLKPRKEEITKLAFLRAKFKIKKLAVEKWENLKKNWDPDHQMYVMNLSKKSTDDWLLISGAYYQDMQGSKRTISWKIYWNPHSDSLDYTNWDKNGTEKNCFFSPFFEKSTHSSGSKSTRDSARGWYRCDWVGFSIAVTIRR